MKKNFIRAGAAVLIFVLLTLSVSAAFADRAPAKKNSKYRGAMRVCWVKEWVSLREEPKKTSKRLAKVPLGDIVYSCVELKNNDRFYECEYRGQKGYILKKYLRPAKEYEPPESWATTKTMTMDEITATGETVLDWAEYNIRIAAAHGTEEENKKTYEILRVGCFLNGEPIWGHEEKVEMAGQYSLLKVFMGGEEDDRQVMLFDGGYGLCMLDLLSGRETWMVTTQECPMGNGAVTAVDSEGTTYIAGSDGPDPAAISAEGEVLWQAKVDDPEVFEPYEIELQNGMILVKYASGITDGYKLVTFGADGEVVSIRNQGNE